MDCSALANDLVRSGLRWAFGIPGGGRSLELVDALLKRDACFVTTGHETTAALMAGAVARVTQAPSAAIGIKGPGLMNMAPGLLSNAYEGYPMLSIAEAYPAAAGRRRHKWLDHRCLLSPFVRGYGYWNPDADVVTRSWRRATSEFPGPVHIELVPGVGLADDVGVPGSADDSLEILNRIRRAERPVLIVGSCALRSPWGRALSTLDVPVFTTVAAKGVIDEHRPSAAGVYTGDGKALSPESTLVAMADLVIAIGVRSGEVLGPDIQNPQQIRIDTVAARAPGVFPPDEGSDVRWLGEQHITEVIGALGGKRWGSDQIAEAFDAVDRAAQTVSWSPAHALRLASAALPGATHVFDTGLFTVVGEHVLRVRSEREIIGTPNGRYMGFGVGYALGAAIADDSRPVVLSIGDGGIRAFFSELSLAVENELTLLVLVMSDGYFGSIRGRAVTGGLSDAPLRMDQRDVRRIADGMSLDTRVAADESALAEAIEAWKARRGPMMVRCDFKADEYTRLANLLR